MAGPHAIVSAGKGGSQYESYDWGMQGILMSGTLTSNGSG